MRIYADHAATTPLSPTALDAMRPFLEQEYGNPSTLYSLARKPRKAINDARALIAEAINADPSEIYFTSGGSESDNLAIKGIALRFLGQKKHFITSSIEHHAVLHTLRNSGILSRRKMHKQGFASFLPHGSDNPEAFRI